MRKESQKIFHGEELINRLHLDPYNAYVNNHRIVGTVSDMLYESGSPVNLLEIKTDTGWVRTSNAVPPIVYSVTESDRSVCTFFTVEADKSVYEKTTYEKDYGDGRKAIKLNKVGFLVGGLEWTL